MDKDVIILQMVETEENLKIVKEAIEVLEKHFVEAQKIILPAFIKNPK
mgnify:CR=1 FL=1